MVLDAIYAAFTRGWQSSPEDETGRAIGLWVDPAPQAYLGECRHRI
jgi:hypothetical protein